MNQNLLITILTQVIIILYGQPLTIIINLISLFITIIKYPSKNNINHINLNTTLTSIIIIINLINTIIADKIININLFHYLKHNQAHQSINNNPLLFIYHLMKINISPNYNHICSYNVLVKVHSKKYLPHI